MNTPNIKVLFEHNTAEVLGDETGVTGALLRDNKARKPKSTSLASSWRSGTIQHGDFRRPTGTRRRRLYQNRSGQLPHQRRRRFRRRRRTGSPLSPGDYGRRFGLYGRSGLRAFPVTIIPRQRKGTNRQSRSLSSSPAAGRFPTVRNPVLQNRRAENTETLELLPIPAAWV